MSNPMFDKTDWEYVRMTLEDAVAEPPFLHPDHIPDTGMSTKTEILAGMIGCGIPLLALVLAAIGAVFGWM